MSTRTSGWDRDATYPWTRLWYPRERPVEPGQDEFTLIREYERWSPEGPRLLTFPEIPHHQVLILLGEAGAGKTRSLRQEAAELRARLAETEDVVRWVNLADFQSETDLVEEVFRHPDVASCMSGSGRLHLFFDSFDEGIIRLGTLSAVLGRHFERADRSRMVIRIVSRPAVWPPELKETLVALFEAENVGTYVLAPLTRDDAATAARMEGLDSGFVPLRGPAPERRAARGEADHAAHASRPVSEGRAAAGQADGPVSRGDAAASARSGARAGGTLRTRRGA